VWVASLRVPGIALAAEGKAAGSELSDDLVRIFRDQRSARTIGREYLKCVPAEADQAHLVSLISQSHNDISASPGGPDLSRGLSLEEWISLRIRDDFSSSKVVNVGGWVLSETEARICALCVLL
jgi:hypothetical protein